MDVKWFAGHLAYTMSKYNMSMIALGLSEELKKYKIAANTLWPRTTIDTAAVRNLLGWRGAGAHEPYPGDSGRRGVSYPQQAIGPMHRQFLH